MSPDALYLVLNTAILPAWILLLVAPGWKWTQRLVHAVWIPFVLTVFYGVALGTSLGQPVPEGGGFDTLDGLMVLFGNPWAVLAGWVHYLVFDLFVGAWEVRDARRRGIGHGWVILPVLCTLMLGPVGLCLYLAIRWGKGHGPFVEEVEVA